MSMCIFKSFRAALVSLTLVLAAFWLSPAPALACPFCGVAQMTLTESLAQADVAVLVLWVGGEKDEADKIGSTTYVVKQVIKGQKSVAVDSKIKLDRYRTAKPGDMFVLFGTDLGDGKGLDWVSPIEVTEIAYNYLAKAPSAETVPAKRLAYFLKFLEFPDAIVSNDAFAEFANAQYKDVEQLTDQLPREQLRKWIDSPDTQATRLGLYGMMIGLCGDESDAVMLEKRILQKTDEFRLGIDGLMGGFLLIRGAQGLDVLDEHKLRNKDVPFSETFAAMQALRFMWTYGGGRIPPERLQQSMRILLDRPEMADLVIADLSRWKDWSVQDRLMEIYGVGEYNVPSIKRAIVRYLLVCSKDTSNAGGATPSPQATKAAKLLDELRKKDQKTVSEAERFFMVP